MNEKALLFNPLSIVHDRRVDVFREHLPGWDIKCIYNSEKPWFSGNDRKIGDNVFYFTGGRFQKAPKGAFWNVKAIVLFTAQSRVPPCNLIQEALYRDIPVIAIEEVYMFMLEQSYINNYCLPLDHIFVASEYERGRFINAGIPAETLELIGYPFCHQYKARPDSRSRHDLKSRLGLSNNKQTATLALAYIYAGGESWEVRRHLLECVANGLPEDYELLVKPHPSEVDKTSLECIKTYAPGAKITDQSIPFDDILDITDVLFNRGNSQVIVDALCRNIPVALVPSGRRTCFDGVLDEVICNKSEDVPRVVETIRSQGMDLYKGIFERHLSRASLETFEKIIKRIEEIAENTELYDKVPRTIELSLFWAWMGYVPQALKTLQLLRTETKHAPVIESVYKMISCKADRSTVKDLLKHYGQGYLKWIILSLWIKILHIKNKLLSDDDKIYFSDYPPEMNRGHFVRYAKLLYWRYIKSGMRTEARGLMDRISVYGFKDGQSYWYTRFKYLSLLTANNIAWKTSDILT